MIKDEFLTSQLWRCGKKPRPLRYECRKLWAELEQTDTDSIRFFLQCQKNVYLCATPQEFVSRARSKDCVAISAEFHIERGVSTKQPALGTPAPWHYDLPLEAAQWWAQQVGLEGRDIGRQFHLEMNRLQ